MFKMEMQWKEFKVNLSAVDADMRADHPHYVGCQAHNVLELWFSEEPSQEDKEAIQGMWDGIHSDSDHAASYKSHEELMTEAAAKKASGRAKLAALGLSDDELKALLG